MTQPTLWDAVSIRHYPLPLKVEDRRRLFAEWMALNREAVERMESWALWLSATGGYVCVDHLFNKLRFETTIDVKGVPFEDDQGKPHKYRVNNNDRALFGRWLLGRHPGMPVHVRRSMFDKEVE